MAARHERYAFAAAESDDRLHFRGGLGQDDGGRWLIKDV